MGNHLMVPASGSTETIDALATGNQLKVGHVYGDTDADSYRKATSAGTLSDWFMTKYSVAASTGTTFDVKHKGVLNFEDRGLVKASIVAGKVGFGFDASGQDGKVLVVSGGTVGYGNALATASFNDSDTIDFSVTDGIATATVKVSATAGNAISSESDGVYSKQLTIHADSSNYLEIDGDGKIVYKPLARIKQTTASETTFASWLASGAYDAVDGERPLQESDVVHIPTSGKSYQHNGGTAGDATDFTLIETPGIEDAAIRAKISGVNGINYTTSTGVVDIKLDPAARNDASLSSDGLLVDVSAGAVRDTNSIGPGNATTVQALFDEITDDLVKEVAYKGKNESIDGNWDHIGTTDFSGDIKTSGVVDIQNGSTFLFNTGSTATAKTNIVWDAGFGPVIKSPDGSDWKLAINNDGSMSPVKL